jgi:hypothetical protein
MAAKRRLLILSCSQRKRPDPGLLPAIGRYDGPAFRVLRRFLREQSDDAKRLDVFILSAMYGLIPAKSPIAEYDQVMTSRRAAEIQDKVLAAFANVISPRHTELCLAISAKYLMALEGWSALVPSGVSVTITNGPQGLKLAKLKRWLWRDQAKDSKQKQRIVRPSGVAHLRGVELRLTPAQVLERAQTALTEDGSGASRFRDWYVEVDEQRMAVKWLVSKLTSLPVNAFTSGEARRVLHQLGLHVRQVTETANDHQGA